MHVKVTPLLKTIAQTRPLMKRDNLNKAMEHFLKSCLDPIRTHSNLYSDGITKPGRMIKITQIGDISCTHKQT